MPNSGRHQQILGERPFPIDPLRFAPETRIASRLEHFHCRVFMAAFRPNRLAFLKFNRHLGGGNPHSLQSRRCQMHLYASGLLIDLRHMRKLPQVKIGPEFAVDPGK